MHPADTLSLHWAGGGCLISVGEQGKLLPFPSKSPILLLVHPFFHGFSPSSEEMRGGNYQSMTTFLRSKRTREDGEGNCLPRETREFKIEWRIERIRQLGREPSEKPARNGGRWRFERAKTIVNRVLPGSSASIRPPTPPRQQPNWRGSA